MKRIPDLSWVHNLYEVGAPIKDAAGDIQYRIDTANRELEEARARHRAVMESISADVGRLDRQIASLWTHEEIRAAKAGNISAMGMGNEHDA